MSPLQPCPDPGPSAGRTRPWPVLSSRASPDSAPATLLLTPPPVPAADQELLAAQCPPLPAAKELSPMPAAYAPPTALSQTLLQQPVSGTLGTGAAAPGAAAGSWGC